jgi:hypothetical protein
MNEDSIVRDVVSGAIMAATSVPQLIAYAETTGFSGYRGLTTAGPPYVYQNCNGMCRSDESSHGKLSSLVCSVLVALLTCERSLRRWLDMLDSYWILDWRRGVW